MDTYTHTHKKQKSAGNQQKAQLERSIPHISMHDISENKKLNKKFRFSQFMRTFLVIIH